MKTIWYYFSRYILKFGFLLAALYLLAMGLLSLVGEYHIPRFFDSGWNMLLIMAGFGLFAWAVVKLPFRTKDDICAARGHIVNGCKCDRCGAVIDESRHVWDGCRCTVCGARKDPGDPSHQWDGCLCVRCGAQKIEDGAHVWEEIESTYYGGNDVNGWGPGGETVTVYACGKCGKRKKETVYDDDFDD